MNARTADPNISTLRVPPHSVEAEQSVLGSLLLDNLAWDRAGDLLTDSDFYNYEHRLIFSAIGALVKQSKPADVITVFEQLQSHGKADNAGGLVYLNALAQSVPSAANATRYAEIVRERSVLRGIIAACDEVATKAFSGATAPELIEMLSAEASKYARRGERNAPKAMHELVITALDRYSALAERRRPVGLMTGWRHLDSVLGGLKPGKVYCLAARPSVGKSSGARSWAIRAARDHVTTLVLSQEMPQDEQTDCVIAELGSIDSERLQSGNFADGDWPRLSAAVEEAGNLLLYFDEQGALTLADIRAKARSTKKLGLLVLDYLQLCKSSLKGKSTSDEIGEISSGLKALAMEMRIPIVVLSQLNREVEKRADKEPVMADLRGSGDIEQDMDCVVMLWTLEENQGSNTRLVGVKVAKHRGGRKGRMAMRWEPSVNWWGDAEFPAAPMSEAKSKKGGYE